MSEKELNAYRFSPEQEPTDEMLEQIMREVAEEARISNQKATEEHWKQMQQQPKGDGGALETNATGYCN